MVPFQTFETLIGHREIVTGFRSALKEGKPGHSHLFHGPKGVGKATLATALVQILLCKNRREDPTVACGICTGCQKVTGGQHPDFVRVEMVEGKTRISVDQIRELSAFLSLTPLESDWKVALIDDASQMNEAAGNALLKTLEEPPDQSILIINTYRPGALLPTIRSRCNKSRFSGLEKGEIVQILQTVVDVSEQERQHAADLCGGNVGQAIRLCEAGILEERELFLREIEALNPGTLSMAVTMADYWSQKERFPTVCLLLKAWFQDQIYASVESLKEPESIRSWLSLSQWVEEIIERTSVVNLNRRLVLEALFIRLARLRGAAF
ncbi:MAG: DNA polymerase III subunit delta' [Magnetococcales bacterium]|nr:DNA polymerase III subunit delta' [Magnetococcales bacterium]